jgi:hypothetical protein
MFKTLYERNSATPVSTYISIAFVVERATMKQLDVLESKIPTKSERTRLGLHMLMLTLKESNRTILLVLKKDGSQHETNEYFIPEEDECQSPTD